MAQARTTKRSSGSRNGRSASQKTEKYRFAQNVDGEGTVAEHEYRRYAAAGREDPGADPDVLLDVPVLKVDSIHFELDDLDAHVALKAQVLDLVKLNVGVDVHLGKVRLDIKGVEAQALLKVRLDHVAAIVDRVLTTLDRNPDLVKSLGRAVEEVGSGAGHTLAETGQAIEAVGEGAQGAVQDIGQGAGQAVGELGEGASQAVGQVGEGAGEAVGQVGQGAGEAAGQLGEGAGQAVGDVGQGAGRAVGNLDQTVGAVGQAAGQVAGDAGQAVGGVGQAAGQVAGDAGQAVGGLGQAAGQLAGDAGQAVGGVGQAAGQLGGDAGQAGGGVGQAAGQLGGDAGQTAGGVGQASGGAGELAQAAGGPGQLAKEAAKTVAREIGSAAADEAKDVSMAATRKVQELGERRRLRRAEKLNATEAALRAAKELDVDIDEVEGTGAGGRITVKDVRGA